MPLEPRPHVLLPKVLQTSCAMRFPMTFDGVFVVLLCICESGVLLREVLPEGVPD